MAEENQKNLTPEELQIQKYQDKIKELKEKQKRKKKKEQDQIRKDRTKRLITVGGLSEKMLGGQGEEKVRERLGKLLALEKLLVENDVRSFEDLRKILGRSN
ncbi:hypothetical protein [Rossellomorea marisflavi]|uniref:hypothetical protein n=1 Tax=Rossellomorea marisflavi TaxID=189381 RepID=UPI001EE2809B|nr:hypothetical protein [Rossellomorea marisflavi]UKS67703.1 hypothetical protein K6T23_22120 [Rossellomorea marisflavi]